MNPALALVVLVVMTFVLAAVTFGLVEYIAAGRDAKCGGDCPWCAEVEAAECSN